MSANTKFVLSAANLGHAVRETIGAEGLIVRRYDSMVTFFALTPASESGTITQAAKDAIVAAYPGTDPGMLGTKAQPAAAKDALVWKRYRTIRAGLVNSIKRNNPAESEEEAVKALLTSAGKAATKEEVIAAWLAAQK